MCILSTLFLQFFKISHVSISNSFAGYLFWPFFSFFLVEQQQKSEGDQETQSLSPHHGSDKSLLNDCPRDSGCYISSENSDNGKEEGDPETLSDMVQSITITESNWYSPAGFLQIFRKDKQICSVMAQKENTQYFQHRKSTSVWCMVL